MAGASFRHRQRTGRCPEHPGRDRGSRTSGPPASAGADRVPDRTAIRSGTPSDHLTHIVILWQRNGRPVVFIAATETRLAAAYRYETSSHAAIVSGGVFPLERSEGFVDCQNNTAALTTFCGAVFQTTQRATRFLETRWLPSKDTDVRMEAFDPIYTVIRKSCRGL